MTHKTIFISYSWDNEEHKEWVLNLSNLLVENGIDVHLDQYDLSAGKEMTYFMEKAMTADKVIIILTQNYKVKADNREGGVGYEYSLLSKDFYESAPDKTRIIPILREGNKNSSCPIYIETRIFHDMSEDLKFDAKFFELIKLLIDKPLVKKLLLGTLPNLEDNPMFDIEKSILDFKKKEDFSGKKYSIINSVEGAQLFFSSCKHIIDQINDSLEKYKKNFRLFFHINTTTRPSILFSTLNYTFKFNTRYESEDSASNSKVLLDFYKGPFELDPTIDYIGENKIIYKTTYNFDLDESFHPIFVNSLDPNIKLTSNDIAAQALREVVTNEIKFRESQLK